MIKSVMLLHLQGVFFALFFMVMRSLRVHSENRETKAGQEKPEEAWDAS